MVVGFLAKLACHLYMNISQLLSTLIPWYKVIGLIKHNFMHEFVLLNVGGTGTILEYIFPASV